MLLLLLLLSFVNLILLKGGGVVQWSGGQVVEFACGNPGSNLSSGFVSGCPGLNVIPALHK